MPGLVGDYVGKEHDFIWLKARWVMWLDVPMEMRTHETVAYKAITGKPRKPR